MEKFRYRFSKKWVVFVVGLLVSLSVVAPLSQSHLVDTISSDDHGTGLLKSFSSDKDFSITIHRIKQEDEIDPWPHSDSPEWHLNMYVNGVKKTFECVGGDVIVDKIFTWDDAVTEDMKFVEVKMELLDKDSGGWPDEDDIADISAYVDDNYHDGDYDNTADFDGHRPVVFKRFYNLFKMDWEDVDENNDYLEEDDQSVLCWYITSGNFDGSTTVDENDASIWFNISIGDTPPYPPEKPVGVTKGWIGEIYTFSTKSYDGDGDRIQYGWDWDDDGVIDELTGYYNPWETATVSHSWDVARIYYVKAVAIDEKGMISGWSDTLKVEINGPYGKSGFEVDEWSLGHVYSMYFDHFQTQEIINIMRGSGNIITALAVLISAIAAASGIPLDLSASIAIATALLRLGVEILNIMDRGMGVYIRVYIIEIHGIPANAIGYIWSQSLNGDEGVSPENNVAPLTPEKPIGAGRGKTGVDYTYSAVTMDPDDDEIAYIFNWGDGNYSCTEFIASGEKIVSSHNWSEKGYYAVSVKAIDKFGHESNWSEPSILHIVKNIARVKPSSVYNILRGFINDLIFVYKLTRVSGE